MIALKRALFASARIVTFVLVWFVSFLIVFCLLYPKIAATDPMDAFLFSVGLPIIPGCFSVSNKAWLPIAYKFGIAKPGIPLSKKRCIEVADRAYREAEAAYQLANKTATIVEFIAFWNVLEEKVQLLKEFEGYIPPYLHQSYITTEDRLVEFEWRLKDAADRAKWSAIKDLRGEYRNNKLPRFEAFADDLECATAIVSPDTAAFLLDVLREVSTVAGVVQAPISNRFSATEPPICISDVATGLAEIDAMEGHQFEYWCADALRSLGFTNVEVTPGSGDQGVDVLAQKGGVKYAIQCKCYSSHLGNTPIQEVNAGKSFYQCHVGVVMTNQYFTPKAKELADATGTLLWDRDWIAAHVNSEAKSDNQQCVNHTISAPSEVSITKDEMLPAAVDVVLETGQASVSMIQRRLKLGYARAARLIDEMEELGIVGPFQGSAPREILITRSHWLTIKSKFR